MDRIRTDSKLQPAFEYALLVLDSRLIDSDKPKTLDSIDESIYEQGFFQLYHSTLSSGAQLPSGQGWKWNQTKGRKSADLLAHNTRVTFRKLIPRNKSKHAQTRNRLPPYKLWIFNLQHPTAGQFTAIWCETGKYTDFGKLPLPSIEEYSFLADFMNPGDALQLWPSHKTQTKEKNAPYGNHDQFLSDEDFLLVSNTLESSLPIFW